MRARAGTTTAGFGEADSGHRQDEEETFALAVTLVGVQAVDTRLPGDDRLTGVTIGERGVDTTRATTVAAPGVR